MKLIYKKIKLLQLATKCAFVIYLTSCAALMQENKQSQTPAKPYKAEDYSKIVWYAHTPDGKVTKHTGPIGMGDGLDGSLKNAAPGKFSCQMPDGTVITN